MAWDCIFSPLPLAAVKSSTPPRLTCNIDWAGVKVAKHSVAGDPSLAGIRRKSERSGGWRENTATLQGSLLVYLFIFGNGDNYDAWQ